MILRKICVKKKKKNLQFESFEQCKRYVLARIKRTIVRKRISIKDYESLFNYIKLHFEPNSENAFCVYLDCDNGVITCKKTGLSNPGSVIFGLTNICMNLFRYKASGLIFVHNHSSKNKPLPSLADDKSMRNLFFAAKLMGVQLLDAMIINFDGHYSYHESGKLLEYSKEFNEIFVGIIT